VRAGAQSGFRSSDPAVLQEINNTVVWLRPHPVIAKVGKWPHSREALAREHAVAAMLAGRGAPVAPPVEGIPPVHDEETGFVVTLWQRLDHHDSSTVAPAEIGESLRRLHAGLERYRGELPRLEAALARAREAATSDRIVPLLSREDRLLLVEAFDRLVPLIAGHPFPRRALHGEPHLGNALATRHGIRWTDLETVCTGPLEWDLAFLPPEARVAFPRVDGELLGLMETLSSAHVATWCSLLPEFPELRRHARHHLEQVRRASGA
jgi:hypothetical protein